MGSTLVIALALAVVPSASVADVDKLAQRALSGDDAAAVALRAAGQRGLDALLARANDESDDVIDRVAAQHDARHSGLYWYTDLELAQTEAKRSGRAILSLRMLGRLDQELSCANSRFFRALLYADPSVSKVMRERFVLHWQSVRPVPTVTVDMGDGRSFITTITGNSVHLVLDEDGKPVDAVPGMLTPERFVSAVVAGADIVDSCRPGRTRDESACIAHQHWRARIALDAEWKREMARIGRVDAPAPTTQPAPDQRALPIAERALAKRVVERPLLQQLDGAGPETIPDATWAQLAPFHLGAWHQPALRRFAERRSPSFVARLVREVAADTLQNEQQHHRTIHAWFNERESRVTSTEAEFTRAIYDTIFATPSSDEWLGLGDVVDGAVVR